MKTEEEIKEEIRIIKIFEENISIKTDHILRNSFKARRAGLEWVLGGKEND